MLEQRGIAAVALGLVRPHMERTGGPRGLWVPFPLGRPLGEPEDAPFQRRVLRAALALLERTPGAPLLEDFPEDAPSQRERPRWMPPFALAASVVPATPADWSATLRAELALVAPWWEKARARRNRSTVGVSGLPADAWPDYAAAFLAGQLPPAPAPLPSPALALRFLADDLKAFYMEAVQAEGAAPSIDQVNAWLFRETVAGRLLLALRAFSGTSPDNALKTVGGRFLVPAQWVPKEI